MQARCYSASTFLRADATASVGNGEGTRAGVPAAPAPAGSSARTFWAQWPGAKGSAMLATSAADVGDLKMEIKKKLPSLRDVDTDSITLQLASEDGALFTAKDAAGNEQPVTLSSMDTIDDALRKAAEKAGRTIGDADKLRIIVDAAAPAPAKPIASELFLQRSRTRYCTVSPAALKLGALLLTLPSRFSLSVLRPAHSAPTCCAALEYRVLARPKQLSEPVLKSIKSAADFDKLIRGRSLSHMQCSAEPTPEPDAQLNIVTDLNTAMAAMQVPGTYLWLRVAGEMLEAPVSNLKDFRDSTARGFEMETNKALARNELLLRTYGKLQLLNDGRGITFYAEGTTRAFLEIDGVIKSSTVALINKAKSSLHVEDVETMCKKLEKLDIIFANPAVFTSEPAGIIEALRGLRFVPVASCRDYSAEVKARCAEKAVHLLETDGSGYRCTLHAAPAANVAAAAADSAAADGNISCWSVLRTFMGP